jgi:ethanolamine ammonia-lyase small subunit
VCGIDEKGKHPDIAIREIVNLVKLMFEKRCSGVELNIK